MCKTDKSHVAQELLNYLARHPRAQDTLEGIFEWWLLEEKIRRRTTEVKEALAKLVESGLVLERKGKDARTHYRINRRKYEQLTALSAQCAEPKPSAGKQNKRSL